VFFIKKGNHKDVIVNNNDEYNWKRLHCKNEYALSNQKNCGNRLQAILLIKFNKLELSNNSSNYSLKVNHLKWAKFTPKNVTKISH